MHDNLNKMTMLLAADTPNIDSAGAVGEFVFSDPVLVTKVGILVTTTVVTDNSNDCDFTLTRRPTVGSASGAVTLGTFKAIAAGVDPAAGAFNWAKCVIADTDGESPEDAAGHSAPVRFEAPNSNISAPETGMEGFVILPGQSLAMTLEADAEADSGAVRGWCEYIRLPWTANFVDQATMTQRTVVAA